MPMNEELVRAKALLSENCRFAAVSGECVQTSAETGLHCLLSYVQQGKTLRGFSVADRIIGKAGALLLVLLKPQAVYGTVMTKTAVRILQKYGIPTEWQTLTDWIENRNGNGLCPMEEAVMSVCEPTDAPEKIAQKRSALQNGDRPKLLFGENAVPETKNTAPDYYCTWQTQLYFSNDGGPAAQRDCLTEENLLKWAEYYPDCHADLILVMDDSWDVPVGEAPDAPENHFGSLELDAGKFPTYAPKGTPNRKALHKLNEAIRRKGWRALGGWVCAQIAPCYAQTETDAELYWKTRLCDAEAAGWGYWKIDWGKDAGNIDFRRSLIQWKKSYAPHLFAEQALLPELIPEADTFRTYDVPALLSVPLTMRKLAEDLQGDTVPGYGGIVNCEDEAYIAAGLGCAMGIMRHPNVGALPDGRPDPSFPALHRNLKTKMNEITRAVRWHRIAPPFGVNGSQTQFDRRELTDFWTVEDYRAEIEAWWKFRDGDKIEYSGARTISRGLPLPEIVPDENGDVPYVGAAKYPNGAVSAVVSGRTRDRRWWTPRCEITLKAGDAALFGLFGYFGTLKIESTAVTPGSRIFAQDLLTERSIEITVLVSCRSGVLEAPGAVLEAIGTMANHLGDTSEPGLVLCIR